MKRVFILGLSAAFLAGGVSSCAKTTKGKMSNEWTISAYDNQSNSTDSDGDVTKGSTVLNGTSLVTTNTNSPNGGTVSTSESTEAVNAWTYTIDKDGTWSSFKDVTSTGIDSSYNFLTAEYETYTITSNTKRDVSGVWNFIGKSKTEDFKRNERVMFNTLTYSTVYVSTIGTNAPTTTSYSGTELAGVDVMTYTVVESKGKELQLTSDSQYSNTDSNGTYKSDDVVNMTLTQE
jgi:hypothetical protein